MRIVTHNVNGIRAATRRGFRAWLETSGADVVALQEVRCRLKDLPLDAFGHYHVAYNPGQLAGRNGVALLTRQAPEAVFAWGDELAWWGPGDESAVQEPGKGEPNPFSIEGRLIGVDLAEAPLTVVSVYVPKGGLPLEIAPVNGGREGYTPEQAQARYERKLDFLGRFAVALDKLWLRAEATGRHLLVLGDFNIAHAPADLRNWRTNLGNEGFLPAERAWMDAAVGPVPSSALLDGKRIVAPLMTWETFAHPFVDVVRTLLPDDDGPYSWWSWRGQAFVRDVGWRIDYHLASPGLAAMATDTWVERASSGDERVSDHAPVFVEYAL